MAESAKRVKVLAPLWDRVLIRIPKDKEEELTPGGLLLPDQAKERRIVKGEVVRVGQGKAMENGQYLHPNFGAGDVVYFDKYTGNMIKFNNEELYCVPQSEVIAVARFVKEDV